MSAGADLYQESRTSLRMRWKGIADPESGIGQCQIRYLDMTTNKWTTYLTATGYYLPPPPSPPSPPLPPLLTTLSINHGSNNCTSSSPCTIGGADCDNNDDCRSGLRCFMRGYSQGYSQGHQGYEYYSGHYSKVLGVHFDPSVRNGDVPNGYDVCYGVLAIDLGDGGCSASSPCAVGEGGCASDAACRTGLTCHSRTGSEMVPGYDTTDLAALRGVCVGVTGAVRAAPACSPDYPCAVGEAACATNDDCQSGRCVGRTAGEAVPGIDSTAVPDGVGLCAAAPLLYLGLSGCSKRNPCAVGGTDCDSDAECQGDLVCFQRNNDQEVPGVDRTIKNWDVCIRPAPFSYAGGDEWVDPRRMAALGRLAPIVTAAEFAVDFQLRPRGTTPGWSNLFNFGVNPTRLPGVWFYPGEARIQASYKLGVSGATNAGGQLAEMTLGATYHVRITLTGGIFELLVDGVSQFRVAVVGDLTSGTTETGFFCATSVCANAEIRRLSFVTSLNAPMILDAPSWRPAGVQRSLLLDTSALAMLPTVHALRVRACDVAGLCTAAHTALKVVGAPSGGAVELDTSAGFLTSRSVMRGDWSIAQVDQELVYEACVGTTPLGCEAVARNIT